MFNVVLVEDEPAALRYLQTLVERTCPELTVAATAGDGEQGFEISRKLHPDLVITDVKMPIVNGIDLVRRLKEQLPEIPVIIVSGHEEFDFVRQALDTGVVDYLLKPVAARKLRAVYETLRPRLEAQRSARLLASVKALMENNRDTELTEDLAASSFFVAVARQGGLPSRFIAHQEPAAEQQATDAFFRLRGRDSRECVLASFADRMTRSEFLARCAAEQQRNSETYHTIVYDLRKIAGIDLGEATTTLYRQLDQAIMLGVTQTLGAPVQRRHSPAIEKSLIARLEEAAISGRADLLEATVNGETISWEKDGLPIVEVYGVARRFLEQLQKAFHRGTNDSELDSRVDELLATAGSFAGFRRDFLRLAEHVAGLGDPRGVEGDVPSYFETIRKYVDATFTDPLTIGSVCERFRISQSYLSKLFRKHAGKSFNEYLTECRINSAKRIMLEDPLVPMKNVARYAGFKDQFYFSRVFRKMTGESPTTFGHSKNQPK
ncbi:MAG TPA: response regulator [Spirochaetia bacterium]|nr:response regulator [Spirochaetia bacterium]